MKVQLANKEVNTTAYGLLFDDNGECEGEKELFSSLLDAGKIVEVKAKAKKKTK